jgi:amino acid transporter
MPNPITEKNVKPQPLQLERRLGLLNATSINMSNMVGTGPFITLPLIIGAMGGPQALLGWFLGAAIAIADGMVWSELAAALPGSGGSYVYLRECFGREKWGRFWAFLFIFQLICSGPLEIASGNIAVAQYTDYLWQGVTPLQHKFVAAGAGILATLLLYRKISSIAKLMVALWVGMLVTVGWVILSGLLHFKAALAYSFPPHAFSFGTGFLMGLGSATLYVMYCYLGYYGVCYLGDEVIDPPRTIPRALVISVLAVLVINFLISLSIIGVIPWKEAIQSQFIASLFMEKLYGNWAGVTISLLILWTAFASIYALILTYSRIPYAAALDGNFFRVFGRLHEKKDFPHISLLLIGGLSVAASFFDLADVISALMTARILVQFVGQIVALVWVRKYHPEIHRPFKMFLYPLPCVIALLGWLYVFGNAGVKYIIYGLLTLVGGGIAFLIMSRKTHNWPFATTQ